MVEGLKGRISRWSVGQSAAYLHLITCARLTRWILLVLTVAWPERE